MSSITNPGKSRARVLLTCMVAFALSMSLTTAADAQTQNDGITNDYTRSRNSQDVGITSLMDSLTNCGQQMDSFLPVWGRDVRVGMIDKQFVDGNFQPADGPRDVEIVSLAGLNGYSSHQPVTLTPAQSQTLQAQHPTTFIQNNGESHGGKVYRALVSGTNGARGVSEVQSLLAPRHPTQSANGIFTFVAFSLANRGFDFSQWSADGEPASVFDPVHVFNTSAIVNATDTDTRSIELMADLHDTLWVTAAGNGPNPASGISANVEFDMAALYNGITVGAGPLTWESNFETSYNTMGTWGANGRMKPDIVFSNGDPYTSFNAPAVGAYAARIRESLIAEFGPTTDAIKSETLKAILLSGATKRLVEESQYGWSRTTNRPLDLHFGAGVANLMNSYTIAMVGQQAGWPIVGQLRPAPATDEVTSSGWDYVEGLLPGKRVAYTFDAVDEDGVPLEDINATLTWNLEVAPDLASHELANLNLRLFRNEANGSMVEIQRSNSWKDNVEHIYLPEADPDAVSYTLVVANLNSSPIATDFALAWRDRGPLADCSIVEDQDIIMGATGGPVHTASVTLRGGETVSSSVDVAVRETACGLTEATYSVTAPDGAVTTFDLANPVDHECSQFNANWTVHTIELADVYLNGGWTDPFDAEWVTAVAPGGDPHRVGFTRVHFTPHGYLS